MGSDRLACGAVASSRWNRIRYRIGQFWMGLLAGVSAAELESAAHLLTLPAFKLFTRMPTDAQRHSLNVLATLSNAGYGDPDLAAAALLHDVGKVAAADAGVPNGLWIRGPLVLAEALAPRLLVAQAMDDPTTGWRYAVWVHLQHPAIGAEWAREAGCSEVTCRLIELHQAEIGGGEDGHLRTLLAALKWADSNN